LEEKVAAPVIKTEINDRALTTQHPLSGKVGTTSPTSGGRSVGIVRSRTKATEFFFSYTLMFLVFIWLHTQGMRTSGKTMKEDFPLKFQQAL
jgi:hypothetical protein